MTTSTSTPARRRVAAAGLTGLALCGILAGAPGAQAISAPPNPSSPNPANGSIAFVSLQNDGVLQTVSADGSTTSTIYTAPACTAIRDVAASPNGDKLAFVLEPASTSCTITGAGLYTIGNGGTGLTQLTSGGVDAFPAWAPDEGSLAFIRERVANQQGGTVMRVNSDGTGLVGIGPDSLATWVAWSPDGSRLLFGSLRYVGATSGSIRTMAWDGSGLATVVADTSVAIGNGVYPAGQAVWTSNGHVVVAGSNHSKGYGSGETCVLIGITLSGGATDEVYRAPVTGSGSTCAYLPLDGGRNLTVAPDSTQLAVWSAPLVPGGGIDVGNDASVTVPTAGGAATALPAPDALSLAWQRIVYGRRPGRH